VLVIYLDDFPVHRQFTHSAPAASWTNDVVITSPTFYHYTTKPKWFYWLHSFVFGFLTSHNLRSGDKCEFLMLGSVRRWNGERDVSLFTGASCSYHDNLRTHGNRRQRYHCSSPAKRQKDQSVYLGNCYSFVVGCASVIPRLHDRANIEQTLSKCIQNTRASARRLLVICCYMLGERSSSMFARSCKRGISVLVKI